MKFSIVSDFTGKAISEERLLEEVDGYDEGNLAELNKIIGESLKALEDRDAKCERIGTHIQIISESLVEIFNYINILDDVGEDTLYLGYGDKVIPCGLEITIGDESFSITQPHQLYDFTISEQISQLDLDSKIHDFTLKLIFSSCPTLMALAALLCLNNTEINLSDNAVNYIFDLSLRELATLFNFIYDTPYTLDPIE